MTTPKIVLMTSGQPMQATVVSHIAQPGMVVMQYDGWAIYLEAGKEPIVMSQAEADRLAAPGFKRLEKR